jgi:hypothetical protein
MSTAAVTAIAVRDPWSLVPSLGNLDAYISAVNRLPMLTAQEESSLARRLRDQGDVQAAGQLVLSHLRLALQFFLVSTCLTISEVRNMNTEMIKGMVQSKTMWFSSLVTLMGVLVWVQEHSALILALVPAFGPVLTVIGVVIAILRVLTEFTAAWKAPVVDATPKPAGTILTNENPGS